MLQYINCISCRRLYRPSYWTRECVQKNWPLSIYSVEISYCRAMLHTSQLQQRYRTKSINFTKHFCIPWLQARTLSNVDLLAKDCNLCSPDPWKCEILLVLVLKRIFNGLLLTNCVFMTKLQNRSWMIIIAYFILADDIIDIISLLCRVGWGSLLYFK